MVKIQSTCRLLGSVVLGVLLGGIPIRAQVSIPMAYCGSINTAGTSANLSDWQSDGLCHDFCLDDHWALAIVKGKSCWCSNYLPAKEKQVSTSECSDPCPGYPDDVCGGNGVWGYMTLSAAVSGTTGGSPGPSTSSKTSTSRKATTETETRQKTVTPSTTSTSTSSSSSSSSRSSTLTSTDDAKTTPTPTPSIRTVTQGGSVSFVTVMPTNTAESAGAGADSNVQSESKKSGLSTGAAVGIAVGLVGAAAAGIIIFLIMRRRRKPAEEDPMSGHSPRGSSAGMMANAKVPEVGVTPPYLGKMEGPWDSDQSGRRRSMLMPIDPRIDPVHSGIYGRADNKSHDSINTLRDDQDYSRRVHQPTKVLRATNPDPDVD